MIDLPKISLNYMDTIKFFQIFLTVKFDVYPQTLLFQCHWICQRSLLLKKLKSFEYNGIVSIIVQIRWRLRIMLENLDIHQRISSCFTF